MSPTDTAPPAEAAVQAADPAAELGVRVKRAQEAYLAADEERRRVFAVAYDSGAMTYGQVADAAGLTDNIVRNLLSNVVRDMEARRTVQAEIALAQLARSAPA